jgi:DivIVA domain-containing protein
VLALFIVLAIVVVAGVAVLVVRDRPLIADDPVGSRALAWSTEDGVTPQDLAEVRFAVVVRGYRMDEVDRVLDDTREAVAVRDERIADLQRVVAALGGAPSSSQERFVALGGGASSASQEAAIPASEPEDGP